MCSVPCLYIKCHLAPSSIPTPHIRSHKRNICNTNKMSGWKARLPQHQTGELDFSQGFALSTGEAPWKLGMREERRWASWGRPCSSCPPWERKNNFPSTLLGSWLRRPCNRRKTNRSLISIFFSSCIHGRDPGKLSNSQKGPKLPP